MRAVSFLLLFFIFTLVACNAPEEITQKLKKKQETASKLKQVKTALQKSGKRIKELKKSAFKAITFSKKQKEHYAQAPMPTGKKILHFKELFQNSKDKAVTIQFYINFEQFSSLPEAYRDKKNKDNIFSILGIHIGDNHIITELNLLKEANVIYIKGQDGINYLDLLGYDEKYNIALLKSASPIKHPAISLKHVDKKALAVGDLIFSLYAVENNHYSFRKHLINFLHYSEFYEVIDALFSESMSYIENTGGLVFDARGDFLGIISLYDSYYENSSFIVTHKIIKKLLPKLKEGFQIQSNAWLGVYLKEENNKVFVKRTIEESPSRLGGLLPQDQIFKINNHLITNRKELKRVMSFVNAGNIVHMLVKRRIKKSVATLSTELTSQKTTSSKAPKASKKDIQNPKNSKLQEVSLYIKPIDKPLKYIYKSKKKKIRNKKSIGLTLSQKENKLFISEVEEGSLAFIYGLKTGDSILEVCGKKINTINEYNMIINNLKKNQKIKIKLLRGNEVKLIAFKRG